MHYEFPFGEKLKRVEQQDKTDKRVFILGVYASAVHSKWIHKDKVICKALAVASEPCIFWDGDENEAKQIISSVRIPSELGTLVLAEKRFNGPSGKVLNEEILKPLNVKRNNAWLCDLLPETRLNTCQQKAINKKYNLFIEKYKLNKVTIPVVDKKFCDKIRREEITKEILQAKPEVLVLLGDKPIKQYLKFVCDIDFKGLQDYQNKYGYGKPTMVQIEGFNIKIVPIAHPTHIGKFRSYSNLKYYKEHKKWKDDIAPGILRYN